MPTSTTPQLTYMQAEMLAMLEDGRWHTMDEVRAARRAAALFRTAEKRACFEQVPFYRMSWDGVAVVYGGVPVFLIRITPTGKAALAAYRARTGGSDNAN